MTFAPFLATVLEFLVFIGLLIVLIFFLVVNPNSLATLQQVIAQVRGMTDIDSVMQVLAPYLINPFALIGLFLLLGVFTPLIEESLKPAIVWLLAKRIARPAQGFALGIISGAGFALVESLLASSTPGQGWEQLLVARAGGGLMHIFGSGLMGWGIASFWQGKRLRLLGTYILSVSLHGLWNSAAIILELGSIQPYLNNNVYTKMFDSFSLAGTIVLGLLVLITLSALFLINRKMRQPEPSVSVTPGHMI
jgi:RsiW-degrading membrane proteinase PrsW (M82 family)